MNADSISGMARLEGYHKQEHMIDTNALREISSNELMLIFQHDDVSMLDSSHIQQMIDECQSNEESIDSIVRDLDRSFDVIDFSVELARYACDVLANGSHCVSMFMGKSVFARSIVSSVCAGECEKIQAVALVRLAAEAASCFDACLALARADFPECLSHVFFEFDDVASFFSASALHAGRADRKSAFTDDVIRSIVGSLMNRGRGESLAICIAIDFLRAEPAIVLAAIENDPVFMEMCCCSASPVALDLTAQFVRSLVEAAMRTCQSEMKLRQVVDSVPWGFMIEYSVINNSRSRASALSILESLTFAKVNSQLVEGVSR
jgi:hypothetical protein